MQYLKLVSFLLLLGTQCGLWCDEARGAVQVVRGPLEAAGLKEVDAVRYLAAEVAPELFEENAKAITLAGAHIGSLIKAGKVSAENVRRPSP